MELALKDSENTNIESESKLKQLKNDNEGLLNSKTKLDIEYGEAQDLISKYMNELAEVVIDRDNLLQQLELLQAKSKSDISSESGGLKSDVGNINSTTSAPGNELTHRESTSIEELEAKIQHKNEQIEDWFVVCKIAFEMLISYREGLVSIANQVYSRYLQQQDTSLKKFVDYSKIPILSADFFDDFTPSGCVEDEDQELKSILHDTFSRLLSMNGSLKLSDVVDELLAVIQSSNADGERNELRGFVSIHEYIYEYAISSKLTAFFISIRLNDLALFLPTRNRKIWAAFNITSTQYILDDGDGVFKKEIK